MLFIPFLYIDSYNQGVHSSIVIYYTKWRKAVNYIFFSPLVPGFVRRHLLNSCYLRCSVPREHSRRCAWHPANSVESCDGAAALQQLWLWSHKSALIRGRARSESKRHAPPQQECHSVYIISSFRKPPLPFFSKCFSVDLLFFGGEGGGSVLTLCAYISSKKLSHLIVVISKTTLSTQHYFHEQHCSANIQSNDTNEGDVLEIIWGSRRCADETLRDLLGDGRFQGEGGDKQRLILSDRQRRAALVWRRPCSFNASDTWRQSPASLSRTRTQRDLACLAPLRRVVEFYFVFLTLFSLH